MAKITSLKSIESIKVGPDSVVLPDGTIVRPEPYYAVTITLDDGNIVQVETDNSYVVTRVQLEAALSSVAPKVFGELTEGDAV
jgi:hypothetical protein